MHIGTPCRVPGRPDLKRAGLSRALRARFVRLDRLLGLGGEVMARDGCLGPDGVPVGGSLYATVPELDE
jgi:hypothetical protein